MRHGAHVPGLGAALPPARCPLAVSAAGAAGAGVEHRVRIAALRGTLIPFESRFRVLRRALAVVQTAGGEILRAGQAHLRRAEEERVGPLPVPLDALAVEQQHAQRADRLGIVLPGGLLVEPAGLVQIDGRALAELVADPQQLLGAGQAQLGGAGEQRRALLPVLRHAEAAVIHYGEVADALRIILLGGAAIERHGLFKVLFHALAGLVEDAERAQRRGEIGIGRLAEQR